jgi:hypothetical protein
VQVRLAEEDRARRTQAGRDRAVLFRDVVREDLRTAGRDLVPRVVQVLQRDGDTVQRAAVLTPCELRVGACRVCLGLRERLRDERDELAVAPLDIRDTRVQEFRARGLAGAEQRGGVVQREEREIGGDGRDGTGVYRPAS